MPLVRGSKAGASRASRSGRARREEQSPRGCNGYDPRDNCLNYKGAMTFAFRLLRLDELLERRKTIWSILQNAA